MYRKEHGLGTQDPRRDLIIALPFIICVNSSELLNLMES